MNRSDDLFPQPGGTPDPYWQRAFDDAFDTPPPRVWEGVERQLDLDDSDGILPLWQHRQGRQSMLFGRWAAGIAASLLLTALGWWAWHREDAIRPDVVVAQVKAGKSTLAPAGPTVASAEATRVHSQPVPQLADASTIARHQERRRPEAGRHAYPHDGRTWTTAAPTVLAQVATASTAATTLGVATPKTTIQTDQLAVAAQSANQPGGITQVSDIQSGGMPTGQPEAVNGTLVFSETTFSSSMRLKQEPSFRATMPGSQPATSTHSVVTHSLTMQSFSVRGQSLTTPTVSPFNQLPAGSPAPGSVAGSLAQERAIMPGNGDTASPIAMAGAPLASKSLAARTQPASANKSTAEPETPASKKQRERPWVSAGVTALSFNPTVAVRSTFSLAANVPQSFASVAGPAVSTSTLQSQVGYAVAFQAGVGVPLGEHWSIESGVGYLRGQNDIQSPARIASLTSNLKSVNTDNLYADLVTRLSNQPVASANYAADKVYYDYVANQAANYTASQQQVVSNTYQFVQVPVQVGYELRPRRKFGLALLTGMVSNWFVRNTIAESITVKPGDGIYRPVTLAGTAGMRLRYRSDHLWSASVAGTFQQNLQSITQADVSLQAQPQQVGLSFSVDRHF